MTSSRTPAFGILMTLALAVPLLLSTGAWCIQWLFRFPPRSTGAMLTALALMVSAVALLFPVPVAVYRLIRYPTNRTLRNIVLTTVASLYWLPGVAILVGVLS